MLSTVSARIRQERAVLGWVIVTVLGAILNLIVLDRLWAFLYSYPWPYFGGWNIVVMFLLIGTVAFFYPIAYSVISSHLLPEKRFVSPFYIELVTIALLLSSQFYVFQANPNLYPSIGVPSTALASMFLFMTGMFATLVGQPFVGVVGHDRHKVTMNIQAPSERVNKIIGQSGVRNALGFERRERLEDGKLISYVNAEYPFQFFGFLTRAESEDRCFMHFEAYNLSTYAIDIDEASKSEFDMRVGYFKKMLTDNGIVSDDSVDESAFPFMQTVGEISLSPTKSKLAKVRKTEVPPKTVAVLIGVAFLAVTAYVFAATGQFTQQELLTTLLGLGFALIGITPWIKGPRIKREEEWA